MEDVRVLLVDDEPDILEVLDMSLGLDPAIKTRACVSGAEALTTAAEWLPSIILLDVIMPVMDGPTTLAGLRKNPQTAHIPVVFLTGRLRSEEVNQYLSLGALGVLPKPFDPMTLAASVRDYASSLAA